MGRITSLFKRKPGSILSMYCTAGYPLLESTLPVIKTLQENGADMMELGMPYSDPLADGPVIQQSSHMALANGMTIKKLFEQLIDLRKSSATGGIGEEMPVLLMGYLNPVLQYGFARFCADATKAGIDGLIIPDLPVYEFETEYAAIIRKYGLDFIFLVTPETSEERVKKLDSLSTGFLYAVSSSSTTGTTKNPEEISIFLQRLKNLKLKNPILVGFGIRDKESFETVCKYTEGAIIGSAFIKAIEGAEDINAATKNFLSSVIPERAAHSG